MEAHFPNGSTVSRIWGDHQEGELLAAFQYEIDAMEFARAKTAEDARRELNGSFYVVARTLRGTVCVIRQDKPAVEARP